MIEVSAVLTECGRFETRNHRLLCTLRDALFLSRLPIAPESRHPVRLIAQRSDACERFNVRIHARMLVRDQCFRN